MSRMALTNHVASRLLAFLLLCASLACSANSSGPTVTPTVASTQGPVTIQLDTNYGAGPFDLPDTKVGLSALSSYTAAVTITFDGTQNGTAQKWTKAYTMLAANDPKARQWTIERTSGTADSTSEFKAELGGLDYQATGKTACTADLIQQDYLLADHLEPASFLPAIIGADEAGSGKVNGVAVDHYTFDQHALGEDGLTESTGELWVAKDGGYLVKYVLTRKGKAETFGEGVEGAQTVDYELTNPNKPPKIQIPDDCPAGMVDAPLLPDAANIARSPGRLAYATSSSVKDAAAFYQKQLPQAAWKPNGDSVVTANAGFLSYKLVDQTLTLVITAKDAKTTVTILLERSPKNP
jgi:hypothetical protein